MVNIYFENKFWQRYNKIVVVMKTTFYELFLFFLFVILMKFYVMIAS